MTLLQEGSEHSSSEEQTSQAHGAADGGFVMRVHGGQHDGRLVQMTSDKCTIGRSANCSLRLVSPEFEPLHCLLVRGQGGVVVRCWSDGTTLNGQAFTVSWMEPGDRLGIGPIELELIETGLENDGAEDPSDTDREALTHQMADELAEAQRSLEQLLAERKELIERLEVLQTEKPDTSEVPALDYDRLSELSERCQSLESELERASEDRQQMGTELQEAQDVRRQSESIVSELRQEVEGVIQLRQDWYHEREQLRSLLEEAITAGYVPLRHPDSDGPSPDSPIPGPEHEHEHEHELPPVETNDSLENDSSEPQAIDAEVNESETEYLAPSDASPVDAQSILSRYRADYSEDEGEPTGDCAEQEPAPTDSDPCQQSDPGEMFSRTFSTDPRIDLSAMRDVANQTARVAIDQHAHRRGLNQALYQWAMALCALLLAGVITQIVASDMVQCQLLAGGCFVIAIWWFSVGVVRYRQATMVNPNRMLKAAESLNTRISSDATAV